MKADFLRHRIPHLLLHAQTTSLVPEKEMLAMETKTKTSIATTTEPTVVLSDFIASVERAKPTIWEAPATRPLTACCPRTMLAPLDTLAKDLHQFAPIFIFREILAPPPMELRTAFLASLATPTPACALELHLVPLVPLMLNVHLDINVPEENVWPWLPRDKLAFQQASAILDCLASLAFANLPTLWLQEALALILLTALPEPPALLMELALMSPLTSSHAPATIIAPNPLFAFALMFLETNSAMEILIS